MRPNNGRVSQRIDKANRVWQRGDAYWREEGHDTPATLSILLSVRYRLLRDQATGESASAATRQTGCGKGMYALALTAC